MKITQLRYLQALAKEQHFGRAASQCFVSQPTLSVAITQLEKELGVQLFERFHHQVKITEVGERIVAQAVKAIDEVEKIKAIAKGSGSQLDSLLSIGGIYTVAPYLFPKLIPALHQLAKNMPLIVQEGFTQNLKDKLVQGELDMAFIALPFMEKGLVTRRIYKEPMVCLLPSSHPLTKERSIDSNLLKEEQVIVLGQGHCLRNHIFSACPACQSTNALSRMVEGTSLETIKQMVASGLGMTVLPQSAISKEALGSLLCVRPFKDKVTHREIALAWRASFARPKVVDVMVNALKLSKVDGITLL